MACLTFHTGFYEPRVRRLRLAAFPPWPAGQFGVWERSLNSQSDVIVCVWGGGLMLMDLLISPLKTLACARPDQQPPFISWLSMVITVVSEPPLPPNLASSCPRLFPQWHSCSGRSISAAPIAGHRATLSWSPSLSQICRLYGAQNIKAENSRERDKLIDYI